MKIPEKISSKKATVVKLLYKLIFIAITIVFSSGWLAAQNVAAELNYESVPGVKPRNVIFILSDDHRYDFMGFT
ncbi:MAG: hypothetical protein ACR2KZ_13845, partial [Segetibacter sp.]